jgi:hypothetical protein
MSDNVTKLPIKDEAAQIRAAFRALRKRQTLLRLARIRREVANDNRKGIVLE